MAGAGGLQPRWKLNDIENELKTTTMENKQPELTRGEEEIMQILWRLGDAVVNEIIAQTKEPRPKYTTVATFLKILENKEILKIGADVAGDLRSLRQIRHFRDAGFVDLQTIAPQWGIGEKSLRKLSAIVLGQRVSKAQRLSNWEAATFTDKQKLYAATDAWVCTAIYDRLLHTPKIKHPEL
jgi:hypothetical protein